MHRPVTAFAAGLCFALLPSLASADQEELYQRGHELHEENCIACHARMFDGDATQIYTREDRMIGSLDGLHSQVQRCETQLGLRWFEDDIEAVATYLNDEFYKFDE